MGWLVVPWSPLAFLPWDSNGNKTSFTYDGSHRVLSVTDSTNRRIDIVRPATTDVVADQSSRSFLVSIAGEPETVGLNVPGDCVSLIMGAQRTCLEYALGAAVAIALAREFRENIGDDWRFSSDAQEVAPDLLLERLRIDGPSNGYREAAEKLRDRLPI